ncbi:hypothetical protein OUO20_01315 [Arthrobacter sp. FX8]|uniref:hypothetical protein n=1 Tax=Arthrobacter sp. FX8 TaxID=2997335 RepID=UPI00227BB59E|nr:hypothetical protein [Arthrobacter sp. FX8]WAJ35431.1 hypothetical protein OUO20_01315 [Arthrobacter sp. FX8]
MVIAATFPSASSSDAERTIRFHQMYPLEWDASSDILIKYFHIHQMTLAMLLERRLHGLNLEGSPCHKSPVSIFSTCGFPRRFPQTVQMP